MSRSTRFVWLLSPHRLGAAVLAAGMFLTTACGPSRPSPADPAGAGVGVLSMRSLSCSPEAFPAALPRAGVLVDSVALVQSLQELSGTVGSVVLTFAFDEEGLGRRRDVIEHTTTSEVADSVWHLVYAASRDVEPSSREWGVRLTVTVSDPTTLEVGRREVCPPVARSAEVQQAMQSYQPTGARVRSGQIERTLQVRAYVNAFGTITDARIVRGELSGSSVERDLVLFLRQFPFNAATVDGEPTGAWVEIPVRVRVPR